MNLEKVYIFDIETNGLLDTVDRLHVLSVGYKDNEGNWNIKSTNKKEDIFKIFSNPNNTVVGHNIICYDLPALKIIYPDIDIKANFIDTLPLSWYLYNDRLKHSLESWGVTFATEETKKVAIDDWNNLSYEQYVERCEGDIRINTSLWVKMLNLLRELYGEDSEIIPLIKLCNFKAQTLRIQEENKILVDIQQCNKNLNFLEGIIQEKTEELKKILPQIPKKSIVNFPKKGLYKADGSLSVAGEKYLTYVKGCGMPLDYEGSIEVIKGYEEPNPQSTSQVKDFLLSKGWKPKIFKDGANGKVPQLRNDDKELCPSIIKLAEKIPELKALEGLSVAQHRAGYLKAFLSCSDENGYIIASYSGMAKTFRVKHTKPICNLPANNSQYGELIRKVLICPPGKVFVNADLSSLEDKTKQCCIYPFDPEYVSTLNKPGYDAHLTIGQKAGFLSEDDVHFFKWYKSKDKDEKDLQGKYIGMSKEELSAEFIKVSKIRSASKTVNYACLPTDNTEVLTKEGWKYYDQLSIEDTILSYNTELDIIEEDTINDIFYYKNAEVVELKNKWWAMESTANHRWYGYYITGRGGTKRKVNRFFTTEEMKTTYSILNSAKYVGGDLNMSEDEATFLGWLLSDGYYKWAEVSLGRATSKGTKRHVKMCLTQSKKKFFIEIKELLDRMGLNYSITTNNSETEVFTISSPQARLLLNKLGVSEDKHEVLWENIIIRMDKRCLNSFFNAFFKGDGNLTQSTESLLISQNKGNINNAIKLAGFLLGYRVTSNGETCQTINLSPLRYTSGQKIKKTTTRSTDVFCLSTSNTTFIIRQNGLITITGNCTYGASAKKISETADISMKEAETLHKAYWDQNWSVKHFAESLEVKTVDGRNWIYSPFSKIWLLLTSDHIKFSAVNQNFGAKVFDTLLYFLIQRGVNPIMSIHDELSFYIDEGQEDWATEMIEESIQKVNEVFKQPIKFESGPEFATSYGNVH
jgi:hypothetical protein